MMTCPLCGSNQTTLLFYSANVHGRHKLSDEQFGLGRCRACRAIFTDIETDKAYYSKYYLPDYYEDLSRHAVLNELFDGLKKLSFRRRYRLIKQFNSKAKSILEVGCGKGDFLRFLPASYQKFGLEINAAGSAYARLSCPEMTVFNAGFETTECQALLEGKKFDVIGLWHVFEHLRDPRLALKNIKNMLADNGIAILEIPNAGSLGFRWTKKGWFHLDTPRHLFHYDPESFANLMTQEGFKIVMMKANPLDYFQDLAFSVYGRMKTKNRLFNRLLAVLIIPAMLGLRYGTAILHPRSAEINTYIIQPNSRHEQDLRSSR